MDASRTFVIVSVTARKALFAAKRAKLNSVNTSRYARRLGSSGIRSKPATLSGSVFSDVETLQKNGVKKSSATPTSSV